MGRDVYDAFPSARDLYERADAVLGRPISKLCFEGPDDVLGKTFNAQPALFVTCIALLTVAREEAALAEAPAFVAGHSLGEYTALTAAGAISFEDGLRLVETRGRVTQAAADATPGGMAAVIGLDEAAAQAVCDEAGVELCNINSPGQLVIGGAKGKMVRACELALARGAKRAIPLDVSGAFHTSLMEPAVAEFSAALAAIEIKPPQVPVVANDAARPMTEPDAIRAELAYQLTHPVRWVQCVEYMAGQGVDTFVEIGPGRVLTGLIKRIASGTTLKNINGAGSVSS
ncbi:MAG: ACP S-malonyltransferase [Chloroflexi bacterium]|nr:ACP S-malonyltransferase [Chloroflexota bacterium]